MFKQGAAPLLLWTTGPEQPDPYAIADNGMVVGSIGDRFYGLPHAFVWTSGSGTLLLGTNDGTDSQSTEANDVNERGQIVGNRANGAFAIRKEHAVMWTPEGWMVELDPDTPSSSAAAINESGQIAGVIDEAPVRFSGHAVVWSATRERTKLGELPGDTYSFATDINDSGQVVGVSGGETQHAFLWTPGAGMVDLGALSGATSSQAFGINNNGDVVGTSGNRGFLWTKAGGMVELGGGVGQLYTAGLAINDHGLVAGVTGGGKNAHALLWFGDTTKPTTQIAPLTGEKLADVRRRGLRLQLTTSEPGSVAITLRFTRNRKTLGTKTINVAKAGTTAVTFKLDHAFRAALRKSKQATFTLYTTAHDLVANEGRAITRITIKR